MLTPQNTMIGSVVRYNDGKEVNELTRLDVQDLQSLIDNEGDFNVFHQKEPITEEIINKCPLPDAFKYLYESFNGESNKNVAIIVFPVNNTWWLGQHISDLQLYFRSLGLEWDLSNLFKH